MFEKENEDLATEVRRVAEHQIGRLERFESGASDQLVKMSVWLTASLLAINSGGALAALNVAEHFEFPTPAALLFGIGILLQGCAAT